MGSEHTAFDFSEGTRLSDFNFHSLQRPAASTSLARGSSSHRERLESRDASRPDSVVSRGSRHENQQRAPFTPPSRGSEQVDMKTLQELVANHTAAIARLDQYYGAFVREKELSVAMKIQEQQMELRLRHQLDQLQKKFEQTMGQKISLDDVHDLLKSKVNWEDFQTQSQKLKELRTLIEMSAETLFLGHTEKLRDDIHRKADITTVDLALKTKADFMEVQDLRLRLERMELTKYHESSQPKQDVKAADLNQTQRIMDSVQEQFLGVLEKCNDMETRLNNTQSELSMITRRFDGLSSALVEDKKKSNEDMKKALVDLTDKNAKIESMNEQLKLQTQKMTSQLEAANQQMQNLMAQIHSHEGETKSARENADKLNKEIRSEIQTVLKEQENMKRRVQERTQELAGQIKRLRESKEASDHLMKDYAKSVEQDSVSIRTDVYDVRLQLDQLRGPLLDEMEKLRFENESFERELQRHQAQYREMMLDYVKLLEELRLIKGANNLGPVVGIGLSSTIYLNTMPLQRQCSLTSAKESGMSATMSVSSSSPRLHQPSPPLTQHPQPPPPRPETPSAGQTPRHPQQVVPRLALEQIRLKQENAKLRAQTALESSRRRAACTPTANGEMMLPRFRHLMAKATPTAATSTAGAGFSSITSSV
eukprot:GILK01008267.1.p1 GENE.GILK01008267.1~~GILK01008267.1.p1  ORF type:complete len:652 (-),score=113.17 GILK01008267.1:185-2140(-)